MKKPNILFIMTDQQAANTLGCYGNTFVTTPNIDKLAAEGSRFDCHISNCPVCAPARSTIITGRSVGSHRVYKNGFDLADANLPTFADILSEKGFKTCWVGKAHWQCQMDGPIEEKSYLGFQETHICEDNQIGEYFDWIEKEHPQWRDAVIASIFNLPTEEHSYWEGRENITAAEILAAKKKYGIPDFENEKSDIYWTNPLPEELTINSWIANNVISSLDRYSDKDEPFFIGASFVDPHDPYNPTEQFLNTVKVEDCPPRLKKEGEHLKSPPHYREYLDGKIPFYWIQYMMGCTEEQWQQVRTHYFAKVNAVDHYVGKLVAALKDKGLYDNTVIIFTSDHGDMMGDHGMVTKGDFHYDSCVRVPMIIKGCGISLQKEVSQATSHLDIFPTIMEFAGNSNLDYLLMEGNSLVPLLTGDKTNHPEYAFAEIYGTCDGKNNPEAWPRTLRNNKWRYTWFPGNEYGQLFDLVKDPDEFENLWGLPEYQDIENMLKDQLLTQINTTYAPMPKTRLPV